MNGKVGGTSLGANSIREQVAALEVEAEERRRVEVLLTRKLELSRREVSALDVTLRAQFDATIQEEKTKHSEFVRNISDTTKQILQAKAECLDRARRIADELREYESETIAAIRASTQQWEADLEREKRRWRIGASERLEKFLSSKASDTRDAMAQTLAPEFQRLRAQHARDLSQLETDALERQREIRDQERQRATDALEEVTALIRDETRQTIDEINSAANRECEDIRMMYTNRIRHSQEHQDEELHELRERLRDRSNRTQKQHNLELRDAQDALQQRLRDLKKNHQDYLDQLHQEHEKKMRSISEKLIQDKASLETRIANENQQRLTFLRPVPGRSSAPNTPTRRPTSGPTNSTSSSSHLTELISQLSISQQEELEVFRRQVISRRDTDLQHEIRLQEAETVRFERECRQHIQREKDTIGSLQTTEQISLSQRLQVLADEISELIVERERLFSELQEEKQREQNVRETIRSIRQECQVFRDGIRVHQQRIEEKRSNTHATLRNREAEMNPLLRELRNRYQTAERELEDSRNRWEREKQEMEAAHTAELNRVDAQIKTDLASLESRASEVRSEIEITRARLTKLDTMIDDYSSRTTSGPSNVSTGKKTATRPTTAARTTLARLNQTASEGRVSNRSSGSRYSAIEGNDHNGDDTSMYSGRTGSTVSTASSISRANLSRTYK